MRNVIKKAYRSSKKGITLVELVVAMTLTSIFAVLCVMLINPIERTYRGTLKLARAQLLADTVLDSIRKECDDVRHDEKADVWITNLSGNDDADLFSGAPAEEKDSGNTLVFRKNNNYSEAIYSCVPISRNNYEKVHANPVKYTNVDDPDTQIIDNSIDTLVIGTDPDNIPAVISKKGIVHFGYYQSKEDEKGILPFRAYDYSDPVLAKTYGNFTVDLEFSDLTRKDGKYPAYVMCKISIKEKDTVVYSRSAVLCFSANGSGKGSGSHHPVTPTLRDIEVKVVWNDNSATDKRPENGLTFTLRDNNSTLLGIHTVSNVRSSDNQRFVFKNINTQNGYGLAIAPDTIADYERTITKTANGYIVKYNNTAKVRLIPGPDFNAHVKNKGITSFIFGKYDDYKSHLGTAAAIPVAEKKKADGTYETVSDYKLYIVPFADGSKVAYVLSDTGAFNGNPSMSTMFKDCSDVTQFTGLDSIYTGNTTNMYQVFMNCRKLSMKLFKPAWDTSNVQTMDGMFRNIACDESLSENITVDISSFNFKNCHHYSGSGATQVNGINSLFRVDDKVAGLTNTSRIEKIVFPSGHKDMSNLSELDVVFRNCVNLKYLENFEDMDLSNVKFYKNVFLGCSSLETVSFNKWTLTSSDFTSVNKMFDGLTNLKTIRLNYLNIPHATSTSGMFTNVSALEHVYINNLVVSDATSINGLFSNQSHLLTVEMKGGTFNTTESWTAEKLFINDSLLEEVDMTGFGNSKCTTFKSMFENCYVLNNITGLRSWTTSGVTNFSNMFLKCNSGAVSGDCHLDISGFTFNQSESAEINMSGMFNNCGATLISFPSPAGAERVTNIKEMFANCKRLTGVENFILSTDDPTDAEAPLVSFPNVTSANNLFTYCYELKNVKLNLSIPKCETITNLFSNCTNIINLDLSKSDFNDCTKLQSLIVTCSSLRTLVLDEVNAPNCKTANGGFNSIFNNCGNLNYLYMRKINLSGAASFGFLPWGSLKELYLSEAKLNGVTSIESLFKDKTKIELIDVSDAEFGAYTADTYLSASLMFSGCTSLKTVRLNGFKAPKNCSYMFKGCTSLEGDDPATAEVEGLVFGTMDTSAVENMESMFENCYKLHGIDFTAFPNWKTGNVTNMKNMFLKCSYNSTGTVSEGRYTINISNFDLSKVTDLTSMFDCGKDNADNDKDLLKEIIMPSSANGGNPSAPYVTSTMYMFRRRIHVKALVNMGSFEAGSSLVKARSMFSRSGVEILDIRNLNFSNLTSSDDGSAWIFDNCEYLKTIIVAAGTNLNVNNISGKDMFTNCKNLAGGNGTTFTAMSAADSGNYQKKKYGRVDGENGEKGYFTTPEQWEAAGH